jgi:membrane protease YdiL (CAAX protease family)
MREAFWRTTKAVGYGEGLAAIILVAGVITVSFNGRRLVLPELDVLAEAALLGLFGSIALALLAGMARFDAVPAAPRAWAGIPLLVIVLLFGSAGEELIFHGYAFQHLVRHLGEFATVLPVGILFGLMHMGNQNVTFLAVFNTMAWGVLLGCAYLRTRALWLPIGMHYGWNAAMPFLGENLSGFTISVTGYELHWRTGVLWSGGLYGLEGGLFTTGVVAGLFFVLYRLIPERG